MLVADQHLTFLSRVWGGVDPAVPFDLRADLELQTTKNLLAPYRTIEGLFLLMDRPAGFKASKSICL